MPNVQVQTFLLSDETLLATLSTIGEGAPPNLQPREIRWRLLDNGSDDSSPFPEARERLAEVLTARGQILRSVTLQFGPRNQTTLTYDADPGGTGRATLNFPDNADEGDRNRLTIAFKKAFSEYQRSKLFQQSAPEVADFYSRREETLLRLEELHRQIFFDAADQRRAHDIELAQRRKELEDAAAQRRAELEHEYQNKLASLESRNQELSDREKQLDQDDNTQARRKLRNDLKAELKSRHSKFSLTADTAGKRHPARNAMWVLITGTGLAAAFSAWMLQQTPMTSVAEFITASVRFGLSLTGFAAATVYFIRWQDRWAQSHADEEFRLARLDLDVDRASWLVEMMLEWRGADGREIPKELIDKLATGLFQLDWRHTAATHPMEDALAAVLTSPAGVKLNFPGGEVNLDKKSVDKARSAST